MALLVCAILKNVAVLMEDGAFDFFFSSPPGGEFESSRVPAPGKLPSKAKKMVMPWGQPEGGRGVCWAKLLMHKVYYFEI